MHIYIDADACPTLVKEILFRVSERRSLGLTLVANQYIKTPSSELIKSIVVPAGPDVADEKIVELVEEGDLVITQDIPLADLIVTKRAFAMCPRGKLFTEGNIKERLSMRDLMTELRSFGVETGGPSAYTEKDRQNFNNSLDRFLTKNIKE
jgi:uncharacterized protein